MTKGWSDMAATWKAHEGDYHMLRAAWSDQLDERDRRVAALEAALNTLLHKDGDKWRTVFARDADVTAWVGGLMTR